MTQTTTTPKPLPAVGAVALFLHPAGRVKGTISRASGASVWFQFDHADGHQVELCFTQRANGMWLQQGKGKHNGQLLFKVGQ